MAIEPCEHLSFEASVHVLRVTNASGRIDHFAADVMVLCTQCEARLRFRGLPMGVSPGYPTMSADGSEARLPADV
jgi:hypothetical protein